jgi:hypothetical protein
MKFQLFLSFYRDSHYETLSVWFVIRMRAHPKILSEQKRARANDTVREGTRQRPRRNLLQPGSSCGGTMQGLLS